MVTMMTQRAKNPLKRTRSESPHCFFVDLVLWLSRVLHEHTSEITVRLSVCGNHITFEKAAYMKVSTIIVGITLVSTKDGAHL